LKTFAFELIYCFKIWFENCLCRVSKKHLAKKQRIFCRVFFFCQMFFSLDKELFYRVPKKILGKPLSTRRRAEFQQFVLTELSVNTPTLSIFVSCACWYTVGQHMSPWAYKKDGQLKRFPVYIILVILSLPRKKNRLEGYSRRRQLQSQRHAFKG